MPLRIDRLGVLVEAMADGAESMDLEPMVPDRLRPFLSVMRLTGRDPLPSVRELLVSSMRRLPSLAGSDPVAADQLLGWLLHLGAWLDGRTDEAPRLAPPDLGGSSSGADPGRS